MSLRPTVLHLSLDVVRERDLLRVRDEQWIRSALEERRDDLCEKEVEALVEGLLSGGLLLMRVGEDLRRLDPLPIRPLVPCQGGYDPRGVIAAKSVI